MNYNKHYVLLFEKARAENRTRLKKSDPNYVYYEKHHILPRCLFPEYENLRLNPWNSVLLTAREHFIAHQLLVKIYPKSRKLAKAAIMMTVVDNRSQLIRLNNRAYDWIKRKQSELSKGKKLSKETIDKMIKTRKQSYPDGIKHTPAGLNAISKANYNKTSCYDLITDKKIQLTLEEYKEKLNLGLVKPTFKDKPTMKTKDGRILRVHKDDPLFDECVGHTEGKSFAIIKATGEAIYVNTNDPRWNSGEIIGNQSGKTFYTDGVRNYMLDEKDPKIDELNLQKGLLRKRSYKEKRWFKDSNKSYHLFPDDSKIKELNLILGRKITKSN